MFGGVLYRGGTYEKGKKMKSCVLLYNGLCYKQMLEKSGTCGINRSALNGTCYASTEDKNVYAYVRSVLRRVLRYRRNTRIY